MKTASIVSVIAVAILFSTLEAAHDKGKEVTLKGTILCAKCALKETDKCTTAIQVQEQGKTVTYYFHDKGQDEEYHEMVCGGDRKEGLVTGTIHEHDGKKYIAPKKVEYAKK